MLIYERDDGGSAAAGFRLSMGRATVTGVWLVFWGTQDERFKIETRRNMVGPASDESTTAPWKCIIIHSVRRKIHANSISGSDPWVMNISEIVWHLHFTSCRRKLDCWRRLQGWTNSCVFFEVITAQSTFLGAERMETVLAMLDLQLSWLMSICKRLAKQLVVTVCPHLYCSCFHHTILQ